MELNSDANDVFTGKFCWEEIEGFAVPFIITSRGELLAEISMLKRTLFNKQLQLLNDSVFDMACPSDKTRLASSREIMLLNEINGKHCDYYYSKSPYLPNTFLVGKVEICKLYEVLDGVYETVMACCFDNPKYGYIRIDGSTTPVPFVDVEDVGMVVPLFFFECPAVMGIKLQLKDHWSLIYLKLFCKLLSILKTFYDHPTLMVVKLDDLKNIIPEVSQFTFIRNLPSNVKIWELTNARSPSSATNKRSASKSTLGSRTRRVKETITIEMEADKELCTDALRDSTVKNHSKVKEQRYRKTRCKKTAEEIQESKKKSNTISIETAPHNNPPEPEPDPVLIAPSASIGSTTANSNYTVAPPAPQALTSLPGGFVVQTPTAILGNSLLQPNISLPFPGFYNSSPSYVVDPQTGLLSGPLTSPGYVIPSGLLEQPLQGIEMHPQETTNSIQVLQDQEEIGQDQPIVNVTETPSASLSKTPVFILPRPELPASKEEIIKRLFVVLETGECEQSFRVAEIPEDDGLKDLLSYRVVTKKIDRHPHEFVCISKSTSKESPMLINIFEIRKKLFPNVARKLFLTNVFKMKLEIFILNLTQKETLANYYLPKKAPNVMKSLYFIMEEFRELYWLMDQFFKTIV